MVRTIRTSAVAFAMTIAVGSTAFASGSSVVQGKKFNDKNPVPKVEDKLSAATPCKDRTATELAMSPENAAPCLSYEDNKIGPKTPMKVQPLKPKN